MIQSESSLLIISVDNDAVRLCCDEAASLALAPEVVAFPAAAVERAATRPPIGVVLDVDSLGSSAFRLAALQIHELAPGAFILAIVSDLQPELHIEALRSGVDHCFQKPLSPRMLNARMRALISRLSKLRRPPEAHLRLCGGLQLDLWRRAAEFLGAPLELTPMELTILELLTRTPGKPVRLETLGGALWGWDADTYLEHIKCHVSRLRTKLLRAGCPLRIDAVRGTGYTLSLPTGKDDVLRRPATAGMIRSGTQL